MLIDCSGSICLMRCYYKFIIKIAMISISLVIIGVISLLVVGGAIYLFLSKDQELNDGKKALILLAIGVVIFLSFLVTTFKHRNLGLRSSSVEDGVVDIKKVFFRDDCKFQVEHKYPSAFEISTEDIQQMYQRNHISLYDLQDESGDLDTYLQNYQETLLFLSKKDQGVSHFLADLAHNTCARRKTAVIYVKLDRQINKENDLLKKIGVYSFEQIQKNYCHFSKVDITVNAFNEIEYVPHLSSKRVAPYLIIDNFQYLLGRLAQPSHYSMFQNQDGEYFEEDNHKDVFKHVKYQGRKRLFEKILKQLVFNCRINIILNTEKEEAVEQLYNIWKDSHLYNELKMTKGSKAVPFPFQFHRWEGLKQYDLFKIISANFPSSNTQLSKLLEINKQDSYTFKDLYKIVGQLKRKASGQKFQQRKDHFFNQQDLKLSVARYYELSQQFIAIKSAANKKISYVKDLVTYEDLTRLEELGLVDIRDGAVYLQ